jgi:hypothetical protein
MRTLFNALGLLSLLSVSAFAFSLNLDPAQTGAVLISSVPATPTQVFTSDLAATKSVIVNTSTATIFIVGYSTTSASNGAATISTQTTTGSFIVPGGSTTFTLDGNNDPYRGPLWAATNGNGNIVIQRLRTH